MTSRLTDEIRRLCGVGSGVRPNEFATVEVRKAAIAKACDRVDAEVAAMRGRLMPEGMEWLLEVWPRWSNGEYCRFGDWWTADRYGDYEPRQLRRLVIYTPELLDEWEQGDGESYGYEWDFMRPSELDYRPDKAVAPEPAVPAADGEPLEVGQTVYNVEDGTEYEVCKMGLPRVTVEYWCKGIAAHSSIIPSLLTHQRPVLDADGNRIEPAMDVWWVCEGDEHGVHAERLHVESIGDDGLVTCDPFNGGTGVELEPSELYVNKPVLDLDGVPIKEGDTVWDISDGTELFITSTELDELDHVKAHQEKPTKASVSIHPLRLTHTKPEPPDSWERLEEDAWDDDCEYFGRDMNDCKGCPASRQDIDDFYCDENEKARDIVRRAKALAGVSE